MLAPVISKKVAIMRGIRNRCPRCGIGRLFQSYLTPVSHCAACGASLGHYRADDFAPWMTIILVGHLLIPFVLLFQGVNVSAMVQLAFWLPVTLGLTLLLLPRCKGVVIGLMWSLDPS